MIAEQARPIQGIINPEHWKKEWAAYVPQQLVKIVMVAVEFFHADTVEIHGSRLLDGFVLLSGKGYQA